MAWCDKRFLLTLFVTEWIIWSASMLFYHKSADPVHCIAVMWICFSIRLQLLFYDCGIQVKHLTCCLKVIAGQVAQLRFIRCSRQDFAHVHINQICHEDLDWGAEHFFSLSSASASQIFQALHCSHLCLYTYLATLLLLAQFTLSWCHSLSETL